ncbi:hypothetical protein Q3G72_004745 [Acer saccharum]|nr:hypothetical protein Q3G72_004745 [Acer saccharum]
MESTNLISKHIYIYFGFILNPTLPVWLDNVQNSSSLCRVLLSAEQTPNSENQQNMYTVDTSQDSSSKPQDDDVKTELAVSERPANNHVPYLPDGDYISRGDFLELLDPLDEPASPSSSSETSS